MPARSRRQVLGSSLNGRIAPSPQLSIVAFQLMCKHPALQHQMNRALIKP